MGCIPRRLQRNVRMSEYVHKSRNVTALLYHLVFHAKYGPTVIDEQIVGVANFEAPDLDPLLKAKAVDMDKTVIVQAADLYEDTDSMLLLP